MFIEIHDWRGVNYLHLGAIVKANVQAPPHWSDFACHVTLTDGTAYTFRGRQGEAVANYVRSHLLASEGEPDSFIADPNGRIMLPPPPDRAILVGLFDLIGALAKRLTGDDLVLAIRDDKGNTSNCSPSAWLVHWKKPELAPEKKPPSAGLTPIVP